MYLGMSRTTPPFHIVTEASIAHLVDAFYAKARHHPVLGPVFAQAIADQAWPAHLQKLYAFWSSVMLTSGRYKGNPVAVHERVAGIEPALFGIWLDLFEQTAAETFPPDIAEAFAVKARRIAEGLKRALFFQPTDRWPEDLRMRNSLAGIAAIR